VRAPSTRRLSDGGPSNMCAHPPVEPARDRAGHSMGIRLGGMAWVTSPAWCRRDSYTVLSRKSAKRIPASRPARATTAMALPRRRYQALSGGIAEH
jgi:hypothetical protein